MPTSRIWRSRSPASRSAGDDYGSRSRTKPLGSPESIGIRHVLFFVSALATTVVFAQEDFTEANAIRLVESAGGRVRRDDGIAGRPVVEVILQRSDAATSEA